MKNNKLNKWFKKAELYLWKGANFVKGEARFYSYLLITLFVLGFVGVGLGVWVSAIGYWNLSSEGITTGRIISGLSSLAATFVVLYLVVRFGAVAFGFSAANRLARGLGQQATRPIPGPYTLNLPIVLNDRTTLYVIHNFLAAYAAVAAFAAYSAILPVYTSPMLYMGVHLLFVFIVLGASTWAPTGKWLPRFQKATLACAVLMVIAIGILFFFPGVVSRWHNQALLEAALIQAEEKRLAGDQALIQRKQIEKNVVLQNASLTMEQKKERIKKIDEEIEFILNGGKSWSDTFSSWYSFTRVKASNDSEDSSDTLYAGGASITDETASTTAKSTSSVFVDAKDSDGVDSGVYLKKGSTLEINGSGTAVWKDIPVGNPSKYQEAGPEGTPPDNSDSWDGRLYGADLDKYLCPTANKGALIARIGNGPWFKVGKYYKGEVTRSGKLDLAVNDVDIKKLPEANWYDNKKGFTAAIAIR